MYDCIQFEFGGVVVQALKLNERMRQLAEHLKDEPSMLVFGRGHNYATSLEAALKVPHSCRNSYS